ncbi:MAG: ATP-binding protein [Solirubrobacterales bacterium]
MKGAIPDSIGGRVMIVLLVGLTLSHIASTAILAEDHHDTAVLAGERLSADLVGVLARQLDRTPADERAELASQLSTPLLTVAVADAPVTAGAHPDAAELAVFRDGFRPIFGEVEHGRIHVAHGEERSRSHGSFWTDALHGFPQDRRLDVSFRLSDGTWSNFSVAMQDASSLWSPHSVVSTLVMMVAIVVLTLWATGWIAAPLSTFARAADRLGRDVKAPPLSEAGPREVRQAVAAFNEMQARIRRFVEDRTRMLAAISHDLRSPITRMRLRAEMLEDNGPKRPMLADLDEMEAMVTSVLEFARGETEAEASQSIDLAAMLAAICDNATDMGLPAEFNWQGRLVCTCRPLAMKRALANLVENAAKYGGEAHVSARLQGRAVEVVIEDEGPGVPPDQAERLFTPFYRLEPSRNRKTGGMGLGLTVARTIIRAHGGDIALANRAEGGLRVTVTLPQAHELDDGA